MAKSRHEYVAVNADIVLLSLWVDVLNVVNGTVWMKC